MLITEITPNLSEMINDNVCPPIRERSNTLPSMVSRTAFVRHSAIELKRTTPLSNLHQSSLATNIKCNATLQPIAILQGGLNAKDYVYLGSSEMSCMSDTGMTLDESGKLIIIKGYSRDVFSGLYHKYLKKRACHYYRVMEKDSSRMRFDALYINEHGKLIGKLKGSNIFYTINIEKSTKVYFSDGVDDNVQITFQRNIYITPEKLLFKRNDGHQFHFDFKQGEIHLLGLVTPPKEYSCTLFSHHLKLPLPSKYRIVSVKKIRNCLQLETVHDKKTRIYYLDPTHISIPKLVAKRVSHKPPQNLYSCLGTDSHEKYDSGQPFSSTRLGNFSSKHIPLLAPTIDNIRTQWKKFVLSNRKGNRKDALHHLVKASDPGFSALKTVANKMITPRNATAKGNNEIPCISDIKNNYQGLIRELPVTVTRATTVANALLELLSKMEENDSISLSDTSVFSAFAGIARGGVPFSPGYFLGLVVAVSKTHCITFEKINGESIRFSFMNKRNTLAAALCGTGQGLEKSLFNRAKIDFFTVMPLEANLILFLYTCKTEDFSFDIKIDQLPSLINGPIDLPEHDANIQRIIDKLIINQTTEQGVEFSLEARIIELRAQIGMGYEPSNYLVIPRTGGGLMLNGEILSFKNSKTSKLEYNTQIRKNQQSDTTLKALSTSCSFVGECKIMPIVSSTINNESFYLPMPIIENSQKKNIISKASLIQYCSQQTAPPMLFSIHQENVKYFSKMYHELNNIDAEMEYVGIINKITKVKITRPLSRQSNTRYKKTHYKLQDIMFDHPFVAELKKIKSELPNKERDNMNKKLCYFFTAKYTINDFHQDSLFKLKEEVKVLTEFKTNQRLQRKAIKNLQKKIRLFQEKTQYQLSMIEIKSVGSLSKENSSIPNLIINFNHKKTLSYSKSLGNIIFKYSDEDLQVSPCKVICDYKFI